MGPNSVCSAWFISLGHLTSELSCLRLRITKRLAWRRRVTNVCVNRPFPYLSADLCRHCNVVANVAFIRSYMTYFLSVFASKPTLWIETLCWNIGKSVVVAKFKGGGWGVYHKTVVNMTWSSGVVVNVRDLKLEGTGFKPPTGHQRWFCQDCCHSTANVPGLSLERHLTISMIYSCFTTTLWVKLRKTVATVWLTHWGLAYLPHTSLLNAIIEIGKWVIH